MKESSKESKEYLLEERTIYGDEGYISNEGHRRITARWISNIVAVVLALELFYLSTILTVDVFRSKTLKRLEHQDSAFKSLDLTDGIIEFENRNEWKEHESPWHLPPSDELDDAWGELLVALNLRVSPQEMDVLNKNKTNRARVENGDYVGVLGVYHYLHCLDSLRRIIHWDYYETRSSRHSVNSGVYSTAHADHCINGLRQAVMCRASTAVYTAEWTDNSFKTLREHLITNTESRCLKWESLDGWARQRALHTGQFKFRDSPFATEKGNEP